MKTPTARRALRRAGIWWRNDQRPEIKEPAQPEKNLSSEERIVPVPIFTGPCIVIQRGMIVVEH
ncbi:hypothetical protein [Roseobacter fucihabitans]|uniref:hypothetical protein n=1 Tax=Roseobacter fucihabitans TaxID=1537242 RepID=UPI00165326A1|nr:hypothetical protein [Roseobacter litoralis]